MKRFTENLGWCSAHQYLGAPQCIAELNSRPVLRMQLEDCLKVANEKRRADKENNIKVKAKANFKLFAEPESAGWKGYSKVRAQLSSMIQFYGYGTNQSEKKYGAGLLPPFFPPSVDWASFKGPGKSSMETNTKIIVYMKNYQDAVDAGEDRVDIPEERVDNPEDGIDIPEEVDHDEDIIGEENHGERFVEEVDDYIELENGFVENVEDIQFELEHPAEETEFF